MTRTRFAPSPTGYLHIGGLRTAAYAYFFAKKNDGKFILRIEDTDLGRYVDGSVDIIFRTLKQAGLVYDEGPDVGGDFGPYTQSQRKNIYHKYALQLIQSGDAYYCFCSSDELKTMHENGATKYDKRCLNLSTDEIEKRIKDGETFVIRQNMPTVGTTTYSDMVFGDITVDNDELEDNVLIKSDGMPTYNFANVIDDHLMGITHVIRGTEYLSSTPKYNHLYRSLGWEIPKYIHLPPIMKDATRKLSKRFGDASFEDFVKRGFLPHAIVNYIALLGWSPKENVEKMNMQELIEKFDVSGISRSSSIFDETKMAWMNGLYIKELPPQEFVQLATPYLQNSAAKILTNKPDFDGFVFLCSLLKSRCEVLEKLPNMVEFLTSWENFDLELFVHTKNKVDKETAKSLLPKIANGIKNNTDYSTLFEELSDEAKSLDIKPAALFWVARIAITGVLNTPGGATDMVKLLGRNESLRRIEKTIERL